MRVAIVGAGLAGLTAARHLVDRGHNVVCFDKGRGPGGRIATKGREQGSFDHGAQAFSARDPIFSSEVHAWHRAGVVSPCASPSPGASGASDWWIPLPSASALPRHLARGLEVRVSSRVTALRREHRAWHLRLEGAPDEGPFDVVLLTAPAPQARALLADHGAFQDELGQIDYEPTWALAVVCDTASIPAERPLFSSPADEGGAIQLVASEGKKPGRERDGALARLVVHATGAFSRAWLERPEAEVREELRRALVLLDGFAALRTRHEIAHRWRYARVARPLGRPSLFDPDAGLGVAGDGLLGPRIEAAWQSGASLAREVDGLAAPR